jgi:hypothetical protein
LETALQEAVKTVETEKPNKKTSGLLSTVVLPTLAQALKRITAEDLVQAASLQTLANYKPNAMAG